MDINLPNTWLKVKLGDICDITYGKGLLTSKLLPEGYPVFGANAVIGYYSEYLYELEKLLISCRGANSGTINMSPPKAFVTNNSLVLNFPAFEESLSKLLFFFLQACNKEKLVTGTAQPQVTINNAVELNIHLPPLNEQKRIVQKIEELFSEIDDGIQSLETAKKQLEIYRQSLFKNAFTGNLTIEWRNTNYNLKDYSTLIDHYQQIREDDFLIKLQIWKQLNKKWEKDQSTIKPVKPSKLKKIIESSKNGVLKFPELPNSWNYVRLGFLIEDPVYGTSKKCDYESNDGIGVLRIPNISEGCIDSTDLKFAYFSDEEIASLKLANDDLLTIRSNGSVSLVGKTALVRSTDTDKLFAGYLIRLRPFKQHVNGKYLHYAFESQFVRNQIEFLAKSTSGVNNINSSELQSLIIPIPSLEEQNEIVNQLDDLLDTNRMVSEQLEVEIKKANHLKSSILTKAFSGQLVPQDPNDEPASVLLERIKAEKEEELAKANKAPKKSGKRKIKTTKDDEPAQQELI